MNDKNFFWVAEVLLGHNLRERNRRLVFLYCDDVVEVLHPRSSGFSLWILSNLSLTIIGSIAIISSYSSFYITL